MKVFAICLIDRYPACNTTCWSGNHTNLAKQLQTTLSSQLGSRGGRNHIFRLRSCSKVFEFEPGFEKSENPTPVQSPATIDATAIQQCLFRTEAMKFVKTVQTPVSGKNKTNFGSGVKRNFWPLRNFWPVVVFQLFCFSE